MSNKGKAANAWQIVSYGKTKPVPTRLPPAFTLLSLPADVLVHCIISMLSPPTLVSFSMTSTTIMKLCKLSANEERVWKESVYKWLFREGSYNNLVWFQKTLRYPKLYSNGISARDVDAIEAALRAGSSFLVRKVALPSAHAQHAQERFLVATARSGDVALMTWLVSRVDYGWPDQSLSNRVLESAVYSRNLKMVQDVIKHGFQPGESVTALVTAVRLGEYEIVQELLRSSSTAMNWGTPIVMDTTAAYCEAAARGDRKLLELLMNKLMDRRWVDERVSNAAAKKGSLEIVQLCKEMGIPWNESTCSIAAEYGQLEVLKYLHENGCLRSEHDVCFKAAVNGHLHVLKWAHEEMRYGWNFEFCLNVARDHQHEHIVKWMKSLPQPK